MSCGPISDLPLTDLKGDREECHTTLNETRSFINAATVRTLKFVCHELSHQKLAETISNEVPVQKWIGSIPQLRNFFDVRKWRQLWKGRRCGKPRLQGHRSARITSYTASRKTNIAGTTFDTIETQTSMLNPVTSWLRLIKFWKNHSDLRQPNRVHWKCLTFDDNQMNPGNEDSNKVEWGYDGYIS